MDSSIHISGRIRAVPLTLEQLGVPVLQRLYAYWERARAGRPWLRHADLRPEEIVSALPYVALIDRPPDHGPGMRIRLVGEEIRNETVGYLRGRLIEGIEPAWYRDHLVERYSAVFAGGDPSIEAVHVLYDVRNYYYHRLILPVTMEGQRVDIVLVATIYTEPHSRLLNPDDHLG